jgi:signal transduction histidine kinase
MQRPPDPIPPGEPPEWPANWPHRKIDWHHTPPTALHQRPDWWPENEPWPPHRGRLRHNPFFRRLGCLFGVFNLLGVAALILVVSYIAHLFGIIHLTPLTIQWTLPFGAVGFIFVISGLVMVGWALRRSFSPLDNLLTASERVAEGDYTVRVPERGPRAMRSLARAFNKMATRLHETDEQRRNLLADVSHELRTPLTVIQGNLEGMLDGVYPADETNLRALLDETHLLSGLIDDLRMLALAESGALQLKKEPTDPLLLIRETVGAFQSQADAKGVTLTVIGADISPLSIDPARIRQVLANLIANALRYSPAGSAIVVTCQQTGNLVCIEVHDSGPGIPAEDLPHIFERFYKSADSGGTGLGLAIVRHIVNAHGGFIRAESAPGQGTTIRVELPITE